MKIFRYLIIVSVLIFFASCLTTINKSDDKVELIPEIPSGMVRLNYHRFDKTYTGWGIHLWGDGYIGDPVTWSSPMVITGSSSYGVYWDIPYSGNGELNFIIHKGDNKDPDGDRTFINVQNTKEYWAISGDSDLYFNLKEAESTLNNKIISAVATSKNSLIVKFRIKNDKEIILVENGKIVELNSVELEKGRTAKIITKGEIDPLLDYVIKSGSMEKSVNFSWESIDSSFKYDGELGALYSKDLTTFKLWAPLASNVKLTIYQDGVDNNVYISKDLNKEKSGLWSGIINEDLKGFFYTYDVTNNGITKRVLDPYAKSMAAFNENIESVGRAAIVDIKNIGPPLDYAQIKGYTKREDAIIWEVHVRDFTSDPQIKTTAQFGTYKAFIEKLDYIKSLGVTHIQLLPVMNYYFGNELDNITREEKYSAKNNTYNWGYDPHNYFSVEGMYSENPLDPELRIAELKELINAIHNNGMGVILDAVYNHTAKISILEDIVPGYYHFMDADGQAKSSYGGGRMGSTHGMTRKLIIDSILHWVSEYKVDGFRFDLMGDLDAETVEIAFNESKKLNPNILLIGEGWRTYSGDDGDKRVPADQSWMANTDSAASFSDEMRNELKSGFGSEGQPRFVTGGKRDIGLIFNNIKGNPSNMNLDDPGDVVQYVAAHDNLPLHDVIAQSINKDPDTNQLEIQKRIRLANTLILTSQGVAFLHAGQEYGRTKQWRTTGKPEDKGTKVDGFSFPWFVHDSYDSSDAINKIDWSKIESDGIYKDTINYTKGLIELRRSSNAFRLGEKELVDTNVELINTKGVEKQDIVIGYRTKSTTGETFYIFVNADNIERELLLEQDLTSGTIIVDSNEAGISAVKEITGVKLTKDKITIDPLTAIIIKE